MVKLGSGGKNYPRLRVYELICGLAALLAIISFCVPYFVEMVEGSSSDILVKVDARVDCAKHGQQEPWKIAAKVTLRPGVWEIKAVGGGWSCVGSDSQRVGSGEGKPWTWSVWFAQPGEKPVSMSEEIWWTHATKESVAKAAGAVPPKTIRIEKKTVVSFWVEDEDSSDNRGVMTLKLHRLSSK